MQLSTHLAPPMSLAVKVDYVNPSDAISRRVCCRAERTAWPVAKQPPASERGAEGQSKKETRVPEVVHAIVEAESRVLDAFGRATGYRSSGLPLDSLQFLASCL